MTTLLLRLAAPLQSWGTSSRFVRRDTDRAPSKSGVVGLLAAAQGRRRTASLEDLLDLRVGVRVDQPGQLERDFQTASTRDGSTLMPVSYRFYLADAVFTVAIEGNRELLETLQYALRRPAFPLFLGRRSCPPAGKLVQGLRESDITESLANEPWLASPWFQRRHHSPGVSLETIVDCPADFPGSERIRDQPLNFGFDHANRQYGWRSVLHDRISVPNPVFQPIAPPFDEHDPMAAFEGIT